MLKRFLLLLASGSLSALPIDFGWLLSYVSTASSRPVNAGILHFDFPQRTSDGVTYLLRSNSAVTGGPNVTGKTLALSTRILADPGVVFRYDYESFNTCNFPANYRPMIVAILKGKNNQEYTRWWSVNYIVMMTGDNTYTQSTPFTPTFWTDMNGHRADFNSAHLTGFTAALKSVSSAGVTFGGGCFAGHGVGVDGGNATFEMSQYGWN